MPLYKKRDHRSCINYRAISLLCSTFKALEKIPDKMLRKITENKFHETQSAFRSGYSTQYYEALNRGIFITKQEFTDIDMEKAVDKVPRIEIWITLKNHRVNLILGTRN